MPQPAGLWTRVVRSPWAAAALFFGVYGVQTSGEPQFRAITAALFTMNLAPEDQFNYGSPLTYFLGAYYQHHGVDAGWSFVAVNVIGLALFFAALGAVVARECRPERRPIALFVIFTSPILFVLSSWLGKSDPYLLAFYLLFTMAASPATQVLLCVLVVLCHRELGALVLVADLVLRRGRWGQVAAGVVGGEAAVFAYTHLLLAPTPQSRAAFALGHAGELWTIFSSRPGLHLFATLGPFWVFALSRRRIDPIRCALFAALLAVAIASYDFTRIFILLAFPLVLDIAREVAADADAQGAVPIGRLRLPPAALWPLVLLQLQCAGFRVLLAQGIRISLRS